MTSRLLWLFIENSGPYSRREEKFPFSTVSRFQVLFHTRCFERFVKKADVDLLQASILIDHNFSLDFVTLAIP